MNMYVGPTPATHLVEIERGGLATIVVVAVDVEDLWGVGSRVMR